MKLDAHCRILGRSETYKIKDSGSSGKRFANHGTARRSNGTSVLQPGGFIIPETPKAPPGVRRRTYGKTQDRTSSDPGGATCQHANFQTTRSANFSAVFPAGG